MYVNNIMISESLKKTLKETSYVSGITALTTGTTTMFALNGIKCIKEHPEKTGFFGRITECGWKDICSIAIPMVTCVVLTSVLNRVSFGEKKSE